MQFNSYEFIFYFFPITVFLYFVANKVSTYLGKIILILSSVVFYSWGRANLLIYLGISILCNYSLGLLIRKIEKRKLIVVISLIIFFITSNIACSKDSDLLENICKLEKDSELFYDNYHKLRDIKINSVCFWSHW